MQYDTLLLADEHRVQLDQASWLAHNSSNQSRFTMSTQPRKRTASWDSQRQKEKNQALVVEYSYAKGRGSHPKRRSQASHAANFSETKRFHGMGIHGLDDGLPLMACREKER
jgi:hypothetical protein